MQNYIDLLKDILVNGIPKVDRTGVGTIGVFGRQLTFNIENHRLPMVTTRKIYPRGVIEELLWFLSGSTNEHVLRDKRVPLWSQWADSNGELGPIYGAQWRNWNGCIDQITNVLDSLRQDPYSRRHIVSAWNPEVLPLPGIHPTEQAAHGRQALAPCHTLFQFLVETIDGKDYLSCQLYQRSMDVPVGAPSNIVSYTLLTRMFAHLLGMETRNLIISIGDAHIYTDQIDGVKELVSRKPFRSPKLEIVGDPKSIEDFTLESFQILDYQHHDPIKFPVAT